MIVDYEDLNGEFKSWLALHPEAVGRPFLTLPTDVRESIIGKALFQTLTGNVDRHLQA